MPRLPNNPDDMEALGWLDAADEARTQNDLRSADISRLSLERYYEWMEKQKSKKKKFPRAAKLDKRK